MMRERFGRKPGRYSAAYWLARKASRGIIDLIRMEANIYHDADGKAL